MYSVLDFEGNLHLICRYIRPQTPPNSLKTLENICRYVSLIPFIPHSSMFTTSCNIWGRSDQILEIGAGDGDEHAVILCNYLLYQGHDAYVLMGKSESEGRISYVAVLNKPKEGWDIDTQLINPLTGQIFDPKDTFLPLKSVGCIFNESNVWANVSKNEKPTSISWDLRNRKNWKAFFRNSKKVSEIDINSIQRSDLIYSIPDNDAVKALEKEIERTITHKIEEWRGRFTTRWNRVCSRTMYELISTFEEKVFNGQLVSGSTYPEIQKLSRVYQIRGFTVNLTYKDMDSIIEEIYNTEVYKNEDKFCEFTLAVHCTAYPGNYFSIWIYVASLNRLL
jgi:coiled-coil and C2 domain-containing protein 2A